MCVGVQNAALDAENKNILSNTEIVVKITLKPLMDGWWSE